MVRVRFAPSPTGPLHIGGVRTALYNYLFAKKHKGEFLLRIEDTDQKRYVDGAEDYIKEALAWAGMIPDEGPGSDTPYAPYRQSERGAIYAAYAEKLVESGAAYYAFDSPEDLQKMRAEAEAAGLHGAKYDHKSRMSMRNSLTIPAAEVDELLASGTNVVVRLLVKSGELVEFDDEIRGRVSFKSDELDDKVLMKADGLPTYHMANVVDDHLMEISHVIRGEEWLSSTAHHVLLYRAFGWTDSMPKFAHLPLILKPVGKGKLSKRDGAKLGIPVFPLEWDGGDETYIGFRESGFTPEGMINFLALLGWNPGTDEEVFTMEDLIDQFSLEKVVKSGARFDYDKAKWFNEQHIKKMTDTGLARLLGFRHPEWAAHKSINFEKVTSLVRERLQVMTDFEDQAELFYSDPLEYDAKMVRKKWKPESKDWYDKLRDFCAKAPWSENLESEVKSWMQDEALGFGQVLPILRLALCGKMSGPSVFDIMLIIGQEATLRRLDHALTHFEPSAGSV